ncbi:MAG: pyridoxal phosphate-dependent aminotransferase [Peptococcaceae bacterium]|jgi:cystathionine beta-lyase|nr:pyridoxal phosphate-dependent aminotransferase [Peptococcaceae bacterium]
MAKYDFDRVVDRRNTYSIKHGSAAQRGKPEDALPLWVADMDFQSPPCVIDALTKQSRHGIFGYSDTGDAYLETLRSWFARRFNWDTEPYRLIKTPGVVTAIFIAVRALTETGDAILIQQPVYYPFASAVQRTGRKLVVNELIYENGKYSIDFDDFEAKAAGSQVKLFILCNPHNPVGRVWTRAELTRLGDICVRHGITVISDEIHQDFVYDGHRHSIFAELNPAYRDLTVTCTAPSKTFNLAGLQLSNIFIANARLWEAFQREYGRCGLSQPGVMGIAACQAAYEGGEDWLEDLLSYLAGSAALMRDFLRERIPRIRMTEPEGTYLAWVDFRALGLDGPTLDEMILRKAKLWLDDGPMFGAGGSGFQRINYACPRSVLLEALERLERAISPI